MLIKRNKLSVLGMLVTVAALTYCSSVWGQSLYVANAAPATVSAYEIQYGSGALSPFSNSPFKTGNVPSVPNGLSSTSNGRFLFAANYLVNTVVVFELEAGPNLKPVDGSPFPTGGIHPNGTAVSPDDKFLFVANSDSDQVSAFTIDLETGRLAEVEGSPFAVGDHPKSLAVAPNGEQLYVANQGDNTVTAYMIDPETGSLTPNDGYPIRTGTGPFGIAITPDGRGLYTANIQSNNVSAFRLDKKSGTARPVPGSPFRAGVWPFGIAIAPSGEHIYVTNQFSNDVSAYAVEPSGALTAVPGSPFATGIKPEGITLTPSGRYLYTGNNGSGTITGFSVRRDSGELEPIEGSPFLTPEQPGFQALVASPSQGPSASFSYAEQEKASITFDGASSSDSDGSVVQYDWDFGDGTKLIDGGPQPLYTYASPGKYEVTLTVTDSDNCSSEIVFTGRSAYCPPSPEATEKQTVEVTEPSVRLPSADAEVRVTSIRASCKSRRRFRIRLREEKERVVSASITVAGRKIGVSKGRRLRAVVDLRGLPRGRFAVEIKARTASGKVKRGKRYYRTCKKKIRQRRTPKL